MKLCKKLTAFIMVILLLNTVSEIIPNIHATDTVTEIKPYDDVRSKDLSSMNFTDKSDLLFTLAFDNYTKWPAKDQMPEAFDPQKLLENGKNPGLGIRKLQQQGYTGAGVTIAYVDQHLLLNH